MYILELYLKRENLDIWSKENKFDKDTGKRKVILLEKMHV